MNAFATKFSNTGKAFKMQLMKYSSLAHNLTKHKLFNKSTDSAVLIWVLNISLLFNMV